MRKLSVGIVMMALIAMACNNEKSQDSSENEKTESETKELSEDQLVAFLDSSLKVMRSGKIKGEEGNQLANQYIANATILSNKYAENDKAAYYLDKAGEIAWQFQQKAQKAVKIFNQVIDRYPDYEEIEKIYYLKAVILDLDLRKKEQALKAYQALLDRFPDSQYKDDATFRMENIDLSEEEMIKKATAEKQKQNV